jgi:hypothetical protein
MVLTADRGPQPHLDVLVIGAGACGLAAAIAAHDAGADVAVIEKLDRPGGNSALSTGSVPAAGTRFQRDAGIADSPDRFIEDLMRTGGPTDCPHLVRRLVETSAATVEWLVDSVGARMTLVTAYKHVGHSVPRLHAPASRRGRDLVDDLLAAVEKRGIPLAVGNGARELIADASGGVIGADVDANGEQQRILARKTVLAVNGFAGNRDLVARFCPEISGAQYFGARGSTGEAVLWGEKVGAALGNIGACGRVRPARQPLVVDHDREGRHPRQRRRPPLRRRKRRLLGLHPRRDGAGRAVLCDLRSENLRRRGARGGVRRAGQLWRYQKGRDGRGARATARPRCRGDLVDR